MADRVEAAPPPAGSNLTPEVFLEMYRGIRTAQRELSEAQSRNQAARKRAKNAGVDLASLALMESLAKLDPDEAATRMRGMARYAAWVGLPIGSQADLFAAAADIPAPTEKAQREQHLWAAGEAGYQVGRSGGNRDDNPYVLGSEPAAYWDTAYLRGQAAIAAEMGPDGLATRRGRKKKAGNAEMGRPA